jgi:hypothetical protein
MVSFDRIHGRGRRPLVSFHIDRNQAVYCTRQNWCPMMDYSMTEHGSSCINIPRFGGSPRAPRR